MIGLEPAYRSFRRVQGDALAIAAKVIAVWEDWLRSATHGVALRGDACETGPWLLPYRGAMYPPGTPLGDSTSCHSCACRQRKLAIDAAR